jgi:phage terminase Nu1 subunit (DNA packaging protein)
LSERYVTAAELAELLGVSTSTIKRWRAAGLPSETWGMGHTRRYLPSVAMRWARDRAARIEPVTSGPVQSRPEHLPQKG